jgi:hypothetical protein
MSQYETAIIQDEHFTVSLVVKDNQGRELQPNKGLPSHVSKLLSVDCISLAETQGSPTCITITRGGSTFTYCY